jgi:hypothetical protein
VICGAELFTSMCAYMTAAWWEGKVTFLTCVRMWVVSWVGNFAGCAIFIGLIVSTQIFEGRDWYALLMATKKVGARGGSSRRAGVQVQDKGSLLLAMLSWIVLQQQFRDDWATVSARGLPVSSAANRLRAGKVCPSQRTCGARA